VLLEVPVALFVALLAAVELSTQMRRRTHRDVLIRGGAIERVIAAAVQRVWDTGLRTPANGVLFAVISRDEVPKKRIRAPENSSTATTAPRTPRRGNNSWPVL